MVSLFGWLIYSNITATSRSLFAAQHVHGDNKSQRKIVKVSQTRAQTYEQRCSTQQKKKRQPNQMMMDQSGHFSVLVVVVVLFCLELDSSRT